MTPNDVKNYRFLDRMIRVSKRQIDELREKEVLTDKVSGSNPEWPYEPRGFVIRGDDTSTTASAIHQRRELDYAIFRCQQLIFLKDEIEAALPQIDDIVDRTIFDDTMHGRRQDEIAEKIGLDQATISRRLKKMCEEFTENSQNSL